MNAIRQEEEVLFAREEEQPLTEEPVSNSRKYLIFLIEDLRLGVDAEYVDRKSVV